MPLTRLLMLAGAFAATAALVPLARRTALRIGMVDRPAPHKFHANPTPYMGGAAVALAVLTALVGEAVAAPSVRRQLVTIALGAGAMAATGLLDDRYTLKRFPRLVMQTAAALGLWAAGIRLEPTGLAVVDLPVTVFAVLALTNAVNLMDNMDGLAAGTVAIASFFLYLAAHQDHQSLVSLMALLMAGSCAGFLVHNFPPAKIFLGDAGTLFLGFLLSAAVIKLRVYGADTVTRAAVPGLMVAVPLFDMTLVVLSRRRRGRPVFLGGTDHSSHRMLLLGLGPRSVALVTYAATAVCGLIGVALLHARREDATWATLGAMAVVALGLLWCLERVLDRRGAASFSTPNSEILGTT